MSDDQPAPPPTLADVAELAGVSRQTVSNAINNPDLLRPETLARVQEAIHSLGYRPNRAARHLRTTRPETGVIVLSQYVEPAFALELLGDGAGRRAYLLKERVADVAELVDAIARVAAGGSVVDPKVVDALVSGRGDRTRSALDRLTPREREVLAEMASGKSNAAIATQLVLSERAVEKHSTNIFSKLDLTEEPDVNRRVMAVLMWFDGDGATAPGSARRP